MQSYFSLAKDQDGYVGIFNVGLDIPTTGILVAYTRDIAIPCSKSLP